MLGADYYETDAEVASLLAEGRVPIGIGENTKIKYEQLIPLCLIVLNEIKFFNYLLYLILLIIMLLYRDCIIDKNARIGKNVIIANSEV